MEGCVFGCTHQSFELSGRRITTCRSEDSMRQLLLVLGIEIAFLTTKHLVESHGIVSTFKEEHTSGIL